MYEDSYQHTDNKNQKFDKAFVFLLANKLFDLKG